MSIDSRATNSRCHLLEPLSTHRLVEAFRSNADATRSGFAVVAFEASDDADGDSDGDLARALGSRPEHYGRTGRLYNGQTCVVLPRSSMSGAYAVAREFLTSLQRSEAPACWTARVSVYPHQAPEADDWPEDSSNDLPRVEMAPSIDCLLTLPTPRWKRAMDIAGAALGLLLTSPLLLVAAILVKLTSPGPIIFRQRRTGIGGAPFTMLKFRTMVDGAHQLQESLRHLDEQDGPAFKISRDPRTTLCGRFLRRSCIDELPQLWNVLRGDMSLVGPRPLPCREAEACEPWQQRRHQVAPGLTCYWQVSQRRAMPFEEWMRLDLRYIAERSLVCDLKLIVRTFKVFLPERKTRSASSPELSRVAS